MKHSALIKIIDIFSFLALALIVSTGALLEYNLPARSGLSTVWSLTRHEWGDIHFYISVFFLVMMSLHFLTHLKYLKQLFLGRASTESKYRIAIGLLGLIALIVMLMAPVLSPVNEVPRGSGRGYGAMYRLH